MGGGLFPMFRSALSKSIYMFDILQVRDYYNSTKIGYCIVNLATGETFSKVFDCVSNEQQRKLIGNTALEDAKEIKNLIFKNEGAK